MSTKDKKFKSLLDLAIVFKTERDAHEYLASQRWGDGVIECPRCEHDRVYVFKDGIRYECCGCQKQFTAKTGTVMEASKIATIKWIYAMYLVLHKKGISSVQLSKDIGVTQKTAWFILQRIRAAFENEEEPELEGTIQLDETFVGGKNKNRHADKKVKNSQGRSFKDKTPVMGMLQQEEKTYIERPHKVIPGKMVKEKVVLSESFMICKVVKDTKTGSLQPIIRNYVKEGSILVSDEWMAYNGLNDVYNHQVVDHTKKNYITVDGHTSNSLENNWSHFKRSIIGVYHKVSRKHMNKYVQEFVFRYNYRNLDAQNQINGIIRNMNTRLKYKDLIAA